MVIRNLYDLEEIVRQKKMNKDLYVYVKEIIKKSNDMLEPCQLKLIIQEEINAKGDYILKWSRKVRIGDELYLEKFFLKEKKGILCICKLKN